MATLDDDSQLAVAAAPTAQLQAELNCYLAELGGKLYTNSVSNAFSQFVGLASEQLSACGVRPL